MRYTAIPTSHFDSIKAAEAAAGVDYKVFIWKHDPLVDDSHRMKPIAKEEESPSSRDANQATEPGCETRVSDIELHWIHKRIEKKEIEVQKMRGERIDDQFKHVFILSY